MNHYIKYLIFILMVMLSGCQTSTVCDSQVVKVPSVSVLPVIDGIGHDACWEAVSWQPIDQVWIPYGEVIPPEDYTGRFKITWSSESNLLYFLVEVTDDVFVDGFDSAIPDPRVFEFDIIEIFIDENHSKGLHVFNGVGDVALEWGTHAENAFAHHIYAPYPDSGKVTTLCFSGDMSGSDWEHMIPKNYANHFDGFALRREGNRATWELALKVFDDTYSDDNPEASRVQLTKGKEMGISLAYCDNDGAAEEPIRRDHFFGSVCVEKNAFNDHWMNADDFGVMVLSE